VLVASLSGGALGWADDEERHPLDPLSREEIDAVVAILTKAGKVGADTRFALIGRMIDRREFYPRQRDRWRFVVIVEAAGRRVARNDTQGAGWRSRTVISRSPPVSGMLSWKT